MAWLISKIWSWSHISLSFLPGAKIGILGLNGGGKSTLLRIMAGVDTDIDGEAKPLVTVAGNHLRGVRDEQWEALAAGELLGHDVAADSQALAEGDGHVVSVLHLRSARQCGRARQAAG